jgi:hypothetical protein
MTLAKPSISLALANEGDRVLQGDSESGGDLGVRHQFRLQATGYQRENLFREHRLGTVMTDGPRPRANHSSLIADMIDADPWERGETDPITSACFRSRTDGCSIRL